MAKTTSAKGAVGSRAAGNGVGQQVRGRPRLKIDEDEVGDAVAELFAEGGYDAVSISATAERLNVSRATLYRTVPSKQHLLNMVFDRSTRDLLESAQAVIAHHTDSRDRLCALIRLHIDVAIRLRRYMPVLFGGTGPPTDVNPKFKEWSVSNEALWEGVVRKAMDDGVLAKAEPMVTARLLLGMCIWVSRWYRLDEPYRSADISDAAVRLIRNLHPDAAGDGAMELLLGGRPPL